MRLREALARTAEVRWHGTKDEDGSIARAEKVCAILGDVQVKKVRPSHGNALRAKLRASGLKSGTINRHLSALRAMLKTAHEEGALDSVPTFRAEREPEGRARVFTTAELGDLESAISRPYRPMICFLVETGARVSEALRLRWQDVDLEAGRVSIRHTKSGRPRVIPLTTPCRAVLEGLARDESGPFSGLSQSSFNSAWAVARKSLKWARDDVEVVPHALRHTCASRLVRAGVGLLVVRDWLGHTTVKTTERYAHLAPDALAGAAAMLEGVR